MDSKLYENGVNLSQDGKSLEFLGKAYVPKVEELQINGYPMEYYDIKISAPAFYRQGGSDDFMLTVSNCTVNLDNSGDYLEVIEIKDGEKISWTKYIVK